MDDPRRAGETSSWTSGGALRGALLVAVALLAGHAAFGLAFELPIPRVHDEFAYLLTGETFATGRVANPPHPHWEHFETFHVLHQPVYQGKYPPGQGAFLALGERLGHPVLGVWLGMALAAAATCWMLSALVPRAWAVAGTLLFATNFEVFRLWGQSYWGGALAWLGGALLFGGLAHRRAQPSQRLAWLMAAGLLLLANTRPFEGALTALAALPALALGMRAQVATSSRAQVVRHVALPLAVACAAIAAWTLYYNWRLTGNAFELPHDHWRAREAVNDHIREFRGSTERSLLGKFQNLQQVLVGTLALAIPFLVLRLRSAGVLYASFVVAGLTLISVCSTRAWPHYLAPVAAPIVFLTVESLRGLAGVRLRGVAVGAAAAALLIAAHVGLNLYWIGTYVHDGPDDNWHRERRHLIDTLEAQGGSHLVLVSYGPDHDVHQEWVYNAADIDGSNVVWAQDRGAPQNRGLLEYFQGRRIWTLSADEEPRRLVPAGGPPP